MVIGQAYPRKPRAETFAEAQIPNKNQISFLNTEGKEPKPNIRGKMLRSKKPAQMR